MGFHRIHVGPCGTIWAFYLYDESMADVGFVLEDGLDLECLPPSYVASFGVPGAVGMSRRYPDQIAYWLGRKAVIPLTGVYRFEGDATTGHGRIAVFGGIAIPVTREQCGRD